MSEFQYTTRVLARWYIFKPKIPFLVFYLQILEDAGIFRAILSILWPFGTFCGHLVYFSRSGILS
jgi:hypothetical protein